MKKFSDFLMLKNSKEKKKKIKEIISNSDKAKWTFIGNGSWLDASTPFYNVIIPPLSSNQIGQACRNDGKMRDFGHRFEQYVRSPVDPSKYYYADVFFPSYND